MIHSLLLQQGQSSWRSDEDLCLPKGNVAFDIVTTADKVSCISSTAWGVGPGTLTRDFVPGGWGGGRNEGGDKEWPIEVTLPLHKSLVFLSIGKTCSPHTKVLQETQVVHLHTAIGKGSSQE